METGRLCGAPAAFTGNDLVSVWHDIIGAHENWLENALFPDRVDEGLQCIRIKMPARLELAAVQIFDRHHAIVPLPIVGHRNRRALIAEQRGQTTAQMFAFSLLRHQALCSRSRFRISPAKWI